ncbi:GDNF-inducible zinc finger protein 1-like [Uranotaenia lowii]|uniref:GDNF-inducible zinc finger protein 1-like n=1 Tax=Uranotaenia lowii TaxID=190385 RepID=UPI0024797971|nr:GDNF-inducible zinc finger protein 1-like [Uranotaenia lowii]
MDMSDLCRLCAKKEPDLQDIIIDGQRTALVDQIIELLKLEYSENDGLPQKVCLVCYRSMVNIQQIINAFRSNDHLLRQQLQEQDIKPDISNDDSSDHDMLTVKTELLLDESDPLQNYELEYEEWLDEGNSSEYILPLSNSEYRTQLEPVDEVYVEKRNQKEAAVPKKRGRKRRRRKEDNSNPWFRKKYKCYICKMHSFDTDKQLLDHLNSHRHLLPQICKLCVTETIELKQIRSLNLHMRMHTQPIKCDLCDRRYTSETGRECHMQLAHQTEGTFVCKTCGKECASFGALRYHMQYHTGTHRCDLCSKTFIQRYSLQRHINRVHEGGNNLECSICRKVLKTIDAYELHMQKMHIRHRNRV